MVLSSPLDLPTCSEIRVHVGAQQQLGYIRKGKPKLKVHFDCLSVDPQKVAFLESWAGLDRSQELDWTPPGLGLVPASWDTG